MMVSMVQLADVGLIALMAHCGLLSALFAFDKSLHLAAVMRYFLNVSRPVYLRPPVFYTGRAKFGRFGITKNLFQLKHINEF